MMPLMSTVALPPDPSQTPHLTRAEEEVAECFGRGWNYESIACWLGIKISTVYVLTGRIASKLDNPHDLRPSQLVFQWASRRHDVKKSA